MEVSGIHRKFLSAFECYEQWILLYCECFGLISDFLLTYMFSTSAEVTELRIENCSVNVVNSYYDGSESTSAGNFSYLRHVIINCFLSQSQPTIHLIVSSYRKAKGETGMFKLD